MRPRLLVLPALLLATLSAQAALIRFDFAGTIDGALAGTSIGAGDPFAASVTLDTAAAVSASAGGASRYDTPYAAVSFLIDGSTPTSLAVDPANFAQVTHQNQLDLVFNFDIDAGPFAGGTGGTFARFQLQYFSAGSTMFGTVADLSSIDVDVLSTLDPVFPYIGAGPANNAGITLTRADVTVLPGTVPEPGTLALASLALTGLWAGRRRRRARPSARR